MMWCVLAGVAVVVALGSAAPALALPANPWTGTWRTGSGELVTLTQTGSQITGTQLCTGTTTLPGITFDGTASADGTTASLTYSSAVCTDVGGGFSGTMSADGKRIDGSGTTQYGTGFTFSWTYQGGGAEPRETPARTSCPGGPWSGRWSARGSDVFSFAQSGSALSGTLVGQAETISGTITGRTADATFRIPEGTGTFHMVLAADANSLTTTGTTTTGAPFAARTSTFLGCSSPLAGVDLAAAIPAPTTLTGGPTTLVAPGTVSLVSLIRSKCVLVKVASSRPARVLASIFSGRRSIRLFGQKRVVFTSAGRKRVCIPVPFRAHTFDLRTRLSVALGYAVGATPRRGEKKPAPIIRRINLVP